MHAILQLWLPIVATAVLIFIASSLIHMVFKWHNKEYGQFSNEDEIRAAINAGKPAIGQYVLPHCLDMKDMQNEAMQHKFLEGPIGFITLRPNGPPKMGGSLLKWFIFSLALAAFCAVLAVQVLGLEADSHRAGHLIGMTSFLAYSAGSVQQGIWMGKPWSSVAKDILDGFIYGTISALTFMWLWP